MVRASPLTTVLPLLLMNIALSMVCAIGFTALGIWFSRYGHQPLQACVPEGNDPDGY